MVIKHHGCFWLVVKREKICFTKLTLIHQLLGGFQGQASDIEIHAQEILMMKKKVNEILSKHTGKNLKTIEKDTDRDNLQMLKKQINMESLTRYWKRGAND